MAYSCVPGCTSNGKKKAGISFHEIPSDQGLRETWLRAISRDNWVPNSTSNYSTVCSLHFLSKDYKEGLKVRRLKKDAVPSVFASYPSYKQPVATKSRSDSSIQKRASVLGTPIPQKRRRTENQGCDTNVQAACISQSASDKDTDAECHSQHLEQDFDFPRQEASDDLLEHTPPGVQQRPAVASRSVGVQIDVTRASSAAYRQRLLLRKKEREFKAEVKRLKQTVDSYKEELRKLESDCYVSAFREVVEAANKEDTRAVFLLDQVRNYAKKRLRWAETTVRHCVVLRNLSTKAYEHLRTELVQLPSRTTLRNYLGGFTGETGFTTYVEERLKAELCNLPTEMSKTCSLIVDEMHIQQKLQYHKQRDTFIGDVNLGGDMQAQSEGSQPLANSLLCFLLCGLSSTYRIPAGYFFTKGCTAALLAKLIKHTVSRKGVQEE